MPIKPKINTLKPADVSMTLEEVENLHTELAGQWDEKSRDPEYLRMLVVLQSIMLFDSYEKIQSLTRIMKSKSPKTKFRKR